MKKIFLLAIILITNRMLLGEPSQPGVFAPDYHRDRLRFDEREVGNLMLRRLTPHVTGYYAIGTVDLFDRTVGRTATGIQGDVTAVAVPHTISTPGYTIGFLVEARGGKITYESSWWTGIKQLPAGGNISANFTIPRSSPTWIRITSLPVGATVGFVLDVLR
jgi:hypothetical protein